MTTTHNKRNRQRFQQKRKASQRLKRVKTPTTRPEIVPEESKESTLLTLKVKQKRVINPTRSRPTGFVNTTRTTSRDREQSLICVPLIEYKTCVKNQNFSPLPTIDRGMVSHSVEERLSLFIDKTAQEERVSRKKAKNIPLMTIYPHDGWAQVLFEDGKPLDNKRRERK